MKGQKCYCVTAMRKSTSKSHYYYLACSVTFKITVMNQHDTLLLVDSLHQLHTVLIRLQADLGYKLRPQTSQAKN